MSPQFFLENGICDLVHFDIVQDQILQILKNKDLQDTSVKLQDFTR